MKKILAISCVFLATSLAGCAQLSTWTKAQVDCASDQSCMADTKKWAEFGKAVASPWGPVATGAAGSVITFIALGVLGLKRKKEAVKNG